MTLPQAHDGAGDPSGGPGAVAVRVLRVRPEDWASHRDLRLDMLTIDPDAFWADVDEVRARDEGQWRREIRGPRIHLQARRGEDVLGGIALLPQGYTPDHVIPHDHAHIVSLWVRPTARGTGISRQLLRAVAELALEIGRPELRLGVDDTNGPARRVYERLGFRGTGARDPRQGTGTSWIEYAARAELLRDL